MASRQVCPCLASVWKWIRFFGPRPQKVERNQRVLPATVWATSYLLVFEPKTGIEHLKTNRVQLCKSEATCTRIRFQKDPFSKRSVLGCPHVSYVYPETPFLVHTDVDWSKETHTSTWKSQPLCTDSPRAQIALFCLFPLLASVVLLYCFTCLCPVEGVYVVCESWRQVIKERLRRQNETQTKDEANETKTKHSTFV